MVTVTLTPSAAADFEDLPRPIQTRVVALFRRLEHWPEVSGVKPLRGNLAGSYRIRTGDYRLQFRVEGHKLRVVKIGHRAKFYED